MTTTNNQPPFHLGVISLFPGMFEALKYGVVGRAIQSQQLALSLWNPRDYTDDKHGRVDDRPYGGGPGMVMMVEPLIKTIKMAMSHLGEKTHRVYLTPQGKPITQALLNKTVNNRRPLLLLAGRYEGVDERVLDNYIDEEWSLGDFVLSGGELAAMATIDGLARLIPGVLGCGESAVLESFEDGLLEHPHYTRPRVIDNGKVPTVLFSGDHQAIAKWRLKQALGRTWLKRPDLLAKRLLDDDEKNLLNEFKREYQEEKSCQT